jgi:hypothetical protein
MRINIIVIALLIILMSAIFQTVESFAQEEPAYFQDRGTGIGVSSKATDFASEKGVMFSLFP